VKRKAMRTRGRATGGSKRVWGLIGLEWVRKRAGQRERDCVEHVSSGRGTIGASIYLNLPGNMGLLS
jgi:hypothetical protein